MTITYRFPPGAPVRYTGPIARKRNLTGRIVGPHVNRDVGLRPRPTYDVDWGNGTRVEFAAHLTARTMLHTDELRVGDIVVNSGMRILIDGPATIYGTDYGNPADTPVYSWPGLVINADELCDKLSERYDPYIYKHIRGIWWGDRVPRPRKDDWPVVGNRLANWHIEPKEK